MPSSAVLASGRLQQTFVNEEEEIEKGAEGFIVR